MNPTATRGIVKNQGLTDDVRAEVARLAALCNDYEGLDFSDVWIPSAEAGYWRLN